MEAVWASVVTGIFWLLTALVAIIKDEFWAYPLLDLVPNVTLLPDIEHVTIPS